MPTKYPMREYSVIISKTLKLILYIFEIYSNITCIKTLFIFSMSLGMLIDFMSNSIDRQTRFCALVEDVDNKYMEFDFL